MLHNRKSKAGSSCFPRMTLIHTVKPFKDSLLVFFRNSDSGIIHNHFFSIQRISDPYTDFSVWYIIFDCIFNHIIDHLIQNLPDSVAGHMLSHYLDPHILFLGLYGKPAYNITDQPIQIYIFFFQFNCSLIELGKPDDIADQCDHTTGFIIDPARKLSHILLTYKTVHHDLRISGD